MRRRHFIRRTGLLLLFLCGFYLARAVPPGWAFQYGITFLEQKQIEKLSDAALTDAYLNALIELEAAKVWHIKAGFAPREYEQFKQLIRYRVVLMMELQRRKLDVPRIEP